MKNQTPSARKQQHKRTAVAVDSDTATYVYSKLIALTLIIGMVHD